MAVATPEQETALAEEEVGGNEEDQAPISKSRQKQLRLQVMSEFQFAWENDEPKRAESLRRLKLYNNQKRDQAKVGDPLLFTVFNTVLAELYEDRLMVRWEGREDWDDEHAENLNALSEYDYDLMEKDIIDYQWDWDTMFFGKGLVLMWDFDRKDDLVPVPENVDPMTFLKDPRGGSVNGDRRGRGAVRFWGREIALSKTEMEAHPSYFNIDKIRKAKETRNLTDQARQARKDAQGLQNNTPKEEALTENYEFRLLEWWTHVNGKKYIVTLANGGTLIVRYQELKGPNEKPLKKWPLLDRSVFPVPNDWSGVSIPDLIEDKQRARSVLINLGMESAQADLYPMYLYNKNKIRNERDLDFAFNKFVPVNGPVNDAVAPIQKSVFHQQVNLILNLLDVAAQKAVAAPEVSQGVQPRADRTLGETELIVAGKSVRHSLSARIFGWSERRFWEQWYLLYKKHLTDVDKKSVRIQGPLAPEWRELTKENLIASKDPDVSIESTQVASQKLEIEFGNFVTFAQIVIQDPETNRRFVYRKLGKLRGLKKQELDFILPPSIHELQSEEENQLLEDNKLPKIRALDDDSIHLEMHNKAPDTPAKLTHMRAHKKMMLFKMENPELFPEKQGLDINPITQPPGSGQGPQSPRTSQVPQTGGEDVTEPANV